MGGFASKGCQNPGGAASAGRPVRASKSSSLTFLWLLILCVGVCVGCNKPIPAIVNLYDMSGGNLLQCSTTPRTQRGANQGLMKCTSGDGEKFQGEYMTLVMNKPVDSSSGDYMTTLPYLTGNALASRWSWASSFGVDLEAVTGTYGIFLLYGNKGTVIDGVFIFRSETIGILGAALDNKGHRYKVMG